MSRSDDELDIFEDEDIKIWNGNTEDEPPEDDVKIWEKKTEEEAPKRAGKHEKPASPKTNGVLSRLSATKARAAAPIRRSAPPKKKNIVLVILSILLFLAARFFPSEGWPRTAGLVAVYLIAGFDIFLAAVDSAVKRRFTDESFLLTVASVAALCVSDFSSAALLMLSYRVCALLRGIFEKRYAEASKAIKAARPTKAEVESGESTQKVAPEYVKVGDTVQVEPKAQVPLDGVIIDGTSSIDLSPLTADSASRAVNEGGRVYSGAVNVTERIRVKVTKDFKSSTAAKLFGIAENAPLHKAGLQTRLENLARMVTPALAIAAVLVAAVPPIFGGAWRAWLSRGVILMALACPAGLIASVSMAYLGALSVSAKNGAVVKGADRLEKLAKAKTAVFCKTGTVTDGEFKVTEVVPSGISEEALLSVAATAESRSEHPIARAIKAVAKPLETSGSITQILEQPGRGISAFVGQRHVYVGNTALLEEHGIKCAAPKRPGTAVHVAVDSRYCGYIMVADAMRDGMFETVDELRSQGVDKLVLLTGDVLSVARPVANKLSFDMMRTELQPQDKFAAIAYLTDNAGEAASVAFITSGENDELLLSRADVGIAVDALGKDALIDEADIIIPGTDIRRCARVLRTARVADSAARECALAIAAVKLCAAVLGLFGAISLEVVILCGAAVELLAALNAARPQIYRKPRAKRRTRK